MGMEALTCLGCGAEYLHEGGIRLCGNCKDKLTKDIKDIYADKLENMEHVKDLEYSDKLQHAMTAVRAEERMRSERRLREITDKTQEILRDILDRLGQLSAEVRMQMSEVGK